MADQTPSATLSKWAGAAGIGFAVLFVAGFGVGGQTPNYDQPDQRWVAWFEDSGHRSSQIVGMFLLALAALLLIAFVVVLLRRAIAAGGSRNAATIAGVAGTVLAGTLMVSAVIRNAVSAAVAFAPNNFPVPSADVLRTFDNAAYGIVLVGGGLAAALLVTAAAQAARGTSVLPGWLVVASYVAAFILLFSFQFLPVFLLPLWTIVVGVVMITRSSVSGAPSQTV